MKCIPSLAIIAACTSILFPSAGSAQDQDRIDHLSAMASADDQVETFLRQIDQQLDRSGKPRVIAQLLQELYLTAPDGLLTLDKIETRTAREKAERRASKIAQYLRLDLDGDAALSRDEISAFDGQQRAEAEALFATADADADGTLTMTELIYAANQALDGSSRSSRYTSFVAFDFDADGTTTVDELLLGVETLAAQTLPRQSQQQRTTATGQKGPSVCDAPPPAPEDQVIVLSGYEGGMLSTVAVAGMDRETEVSRVTIEAGDAPIYLFLTAYTAMVWEVSGATDRLSRVVVQTARTQEGPGAGVVGVPKEKVHFVSGVACLSPVHDLSGGKGMIAYREITNKLKREPDNMQAFYTIGQVAVPSGEGQTGTGEDTNIIVYGDKRYELTPNGPRLLDGPEGQQPGDKPYGAGIVFQSLQRFHPFGVRDIDPATVVAERPVVAYDVLPQQAGLLQLLLEGKLRYTRDGYFVIQAPIPRFPAGLNGAHGVKFILGEGVPMPDGSAGHSSVVSAETGECLSRICR